MARAVASSQLHLRIPPAEKAQVQAQAREYGISTSAYLRILAQEDREREHRAELLRKSHPQGTRTVYTIDSR